MTPVPLFWLAALRPRRRHARGAAVAAAAPARGRAGRSAGGLAAATAIFRDHKRQLDADLAAGAITAPEREAALDELASRLGAEISPRHPEQRDAPLRRTRERPRAVDRRAGSRGDRAGRRAYSPTSSSATRPRCRRRRWRRGTAASPRTQIARWSTTSRRRCRPIPTTERLGAARAVVRDARTLPRGRRRVCAGGAANAARRAASRRLGRRRSDGAGTQARRPAGRADRARARARSEEHEGAGAVRHVEARRRRPCGLDRAMARAPRDAAERRRRCARNRRGDRAARSAAIETSGASAATPGAAAPAPSVAAAPAATPAPPVGGSVRGHRPRRARPQARDACRAGRHGVHLRARGRRTADAARAMQRFRAAELPRTFALDDAMAMAPGTTISTTPRSWSRRASASRATRSRKPGDLRGSARRWRPARRTCAWSSARSSRSRHL